MLLVDWFESFVGAVVAAWSGLNPYIAAPSFLSPPWTILILTPLVWIPWWLVLLLPTIALVGLSIHRKKPYLIAIVGTSFSFIALSLYGNIDWIVMVGLAVQGPLGLILASVKPQAGVFGFIGEMRRKTWKDRFLFLLPLVIVAIIGTLIYPNWISHMFTVRNFGANRSLSLFPYSIPVGIWAFWRSWRKGDPIWGVVGTLCFSPYFYIHSLAPLIFLVSDRNWKWGLALNALTWMIVLLNVAKVLNLAL